MKYDLRIASVMALFFAIGVASISYGAQPKLVEQPALPSQTGSCANATLITLSGVYSPYSVHLIKAEVSGHVVKINATEGQTLKAGTPIMEIDCSALEQQLKNMTDVLKALKDEKRVLIKNLGLIRKKYIRYLRLKKEGHIEQQLVEDMESEVNSVQMSVIDNRRRIAETKRAIADIKDRIKKSRPAFDHPLYVSQNFKELYETVVPGENLSRLLDISRAKIHLVFSLSCFKRFEQTLRASGTLPFTIVLENGQTVDAKGRVEKLKIDPDNRYLYSYGFDLVFPPVKGLLWGQVVQVRLKP